MSGSGPIFEYQRELTAKLEQALRERDEARAALAGAENSLTAEQEFSARLSRECQERHDELREELRVALAERDQARAEVERLRRALICSEDDFGHRCIRCDSEVEP